MADDATMAAGHSLLLDHIMATRSESRLGRITVGRLLPHMRREMDRNAYKGDAWREADPNGLVDDLVYHALKLARAADSVGKDTGHVQTHSRRSALEFAADVANLAAMVADNLGCLEPGFESTDSPALGWGGDNIKGLAAETAAQARQTVELDPDY